MTSGDEDARSRVADERFFRDVLGHYPTGVVAVTTTAVDGQPLGMIVGSFGSVSLEPRLVSFMASRTSSSYARLREHDRFCVNMLSDRQEEVCRALAVKDATDKFAAIPWRPSPLGSPVIDGVVAWVDCEVVEEVEAGDHYIVIGRVVDLEVGSPGLPLIFHNGGYGSFTPQTRVMPATADTLEYIRLADLARAAVEPLVAELGLECAVMTTIGDHVVRVASIGAPPVGSAAIQVGQRLPFWAPLGVLMVAWESRERQEDWIRRGAGGTEAAAFDAHTTALARVRDRGWLITMKSEAFTAIDEVLAHYPEGPEKSARLLELERRLGGPAAYDYELLEWEGRYDVRNVSAPVFGPDGRACMYLSLYGFPAGSLGWDVTRAAERLCEVATALGENLDG